MTSSKLPANLPPCPHCAAAAPYKWGRAHGLPRYRCRDCGKTYNALTCTPAAGLRHRHCWRRFIDAARIGHSVRKTAKVCRVSASTVHRWKQRLDPAVAVRVIGVEVKVDLKTSNYQVAANDECSQPVPESRHTFADLFAGIGGFRLGLEANGGRCVFTSEINRFARQTYAANFPADGHTINGDIKQIDAAEIADHDILLAGFPCQAFSTVGVSDRNSRGRPHGFADETHGTLFFDVARVIDEKRPRAFVLENVKGLVGHDGGRTFRTIRETLERDLGYHVHYRVIDAALFVPQHRERIFFVGFREPTEFSFDDIRVPPSVSPVGSILEDEVDPRHVLKPSYWQYLQDVAAKHAAKGNGFSYGLVDAETKATRTLLARYCHDGAEILVSRGLGEPPRKLSVRECLRLQGFPEWFETPVSNRQAYRQIGNAVAVPVVREIGRIVMAALDRAAVIASMRQAA